MKKLLLLLITTISFLTYSCSSNEVEPKIEETAIGDYTAITYEYGGREIGITPNTKPESGFAIIRKGNVKKYNIFVLVTNSKGASWGSLDGVEFDSFTKRGNKYYITEEIYLEDDLMYINWMGSFGDMYKFTLKKN